MHQRGIIVTLLGLILLAFVALFIRQNRVQPTTKVKTADITMTNQKDSAIASRQIMVSFNGQSFTATLNDSPVAQAIQKQIPFTVSFTAYGNGQEKIGDLPFTPQLGNYNYDDNGQKGKLAYWQPDNRLVLYHGPVGSYPGIKVIGSFDNTKAVYALKKMADNTEVTFSK